MTNFTIYGVYVVIIVAAVALTSVAKLLLKKVCKVESLGMTWEYLLSILSFVFAASGNFMWLYLGCGFTSTEYLSVMCTLAGSSTYIIYLLLFQSTRKIALQIINSILAKKSVKEITEEVTQIVEAGDNTTEEQAESLLGANGDKIESVINFLKKDNDE